MRRALGLTLTARAQAKQAFALVELNPDRVRAELERTDEVLSELRAAGRALGRAQGTRTLAHGAERAGHGSTGIRPPTPPAGAEVHVRRPAACLGRIQAGAAQRRPGETESRAGPDLRPSRKGEGTGGSERQRTGPATIAEGRELAGTGSHRIRKPALGPDAEVHAGGPGLALRAWELARGSTTLPLVEWALGETDQLLDTWSDELRQSDQDQVRTLLDQAVDQQARARQSFNDRDLKTALQATTLARKFLDRALEAVNSDQ